MTGTMCRQKGERQQSARSGRSSSQRHRIRLLKSCLRLICELSAKSFLYMRIRLDAFGPGGLLALTTKFMLRMGLAAVFGGELERSNMRRTERCPLFCYTVRLVL